MLGIRHNIRFFVIHKSTPWNMVRMAMRNEQMSAIGANIKAYSSIL